MEPVLLLHVAATWAMVGLIWFVQLVHYPLFAAVGTDGFVRYESQHARRTTWIVGVFMPAEAITAALLLVDRPDGIDASLVGVGFALVVVLWLSTALWQAPMHGRLSSGYDADLQERLVRSNWLRTVGWTVRGGLVLAMIGAALG